VDIVLHYREAIDILELRGAFAGSTDSTRLRDALAPTMRLGAPIVILDLSAIERLGGELLGELLAARQRVRSAGGILKLVASRSCRTLLSEAGFDSLGELYDRRDTAVESFEPETMTAGIP